MVAIGNDPASSSQSGNVLFPWQLQKMLTEVESDGKSDIVSWLPDGKAFKVHNVSVFVAEILPSYFKQTKYKSFQRQCNLWGFERMTTLGAEKGAYWHADFLRDQPSLCSRLTRQKATRKSSASKRVPKGQEIVIQAHIAMKQTSDPTAAATATVDSTIKLANQVSDDEASIPSVGAIPSGAPTTSAVDFEGCTFFPLEWEYYQEMTRRIQNVGVKATYHQQVQIVSKKDVDPKCSAGTRSRPIKRSLIALH